VAGHVKNRPRLWVFREGCSTVKPLIIFELANNHQGSPSLARQIVEALTRTKKPYESLFEFAVKFQFRDIQSFIDPDADPAVNKHVSRFRSTQLCDGDWANLTEQVRQDGYVVITTVFDESSVDKARRLGISTLKIASCSAQEWPLIQKAAHASDHLIVSTAGLGLDQVDALYSFLRHECRGGFTLLHCAGVYPAPLESIKLETVRRFRKRYPRARIGYSGHEAPEAHNVSATALAVGAEVIERHVGLATPEKPLNAYSLDIPYVNEWLMMLREAALLLGEAKGSDYSNLAEHASLAELRRGVFASQHLSPNMEISRDDKAGKANSYSVRDSSRLRPEPWHRGADRVVLHYTSPCPPTCRDRTPSPLASARTRSLRLLFGRFSALRPLRFRDARQDHRTPEGERTSIDRNSCRLRHHRGSGRGT
jgi:sialic acid synthase SpsE